MQQWLYEVKVINEPDTWHGNSRVFETKEDAEFEGRALYMKWSMTTDYRVRQIK